MSEISKEVKQQIAKRRTFAIISHPDAGKTTLTEKFLLYGGAINQAGSDSQTCGIRLDGNRKRERNLRDFFGLTVQL